MATEKALAIRKSEAQARIAKAARKLAKAVGMEGVKAEALTPTHKDSAIAGIMELEAIADLLEEMGEKAAPDTDAKGGKSKEMADNDANTEDKTPNQPNTPPYPEPKVDVEVSTDTPGDADAAPDLDGFLDDAAEIKADKPAPGATAKASGSGSK